MKNKAPFLFIFAGEHSGDLHGGHLIKALKSQAPKIDITGVPGPKMRAEGMDKVLVMEDFEVMGLSDVIRALPKLYRHFYRFRNEILSKKPDGVVLIDYPGFNLRLASSLRKHGYKGKIVHYIAPTVWAWGKDRINTMAKTLDLLLTIYPFEASFFADAPLKVEYVGNPLSEYQKNYPYNNQWRQQMGIPANKNMLALFPGSRTTEVKRNLPYMLEAAMLYKEAYPEATFGISGMHQNEISARFDKLKQHVFFVPKNFTYELMRDCHMAMAKSGTVTLELALHQKPTVVIYKLTMLNRLYAQHVLKLNLPHYCIVNILAKGIAFPELIEKGLSADNIFDHLQMLNVHENRDKCIAACQDIRNHLQVTNCSQNAAKAILSVLQ